MEQRRLNPAIISIFVIVLIGIAAGAAFAANNKNQATVSTDNQASEQTASREEQPVTIETPTTDNSDTASDTTYANGTYTTTGSYSTPGGTESVTVTVTLANDTVSSISTNGSASRGDSSMYQSKFLSGYKSQVVGKDIDSVSLSRVAGSSLTSNGFNAAIEKIKDEAVS